MPQDRDKSSAAGTTGIASIDSAGTVGVPAFQLPLSHYMSAAAKRAFIVQNYNPPALRDAMMQTDVRELRAGVDRYLLAPMLERARRSYATNVETVNIAGVSAAVVTPDSGIAERNRDRVLINLHGGFFTVGAGMGALVEALPIAAIDRIKVISIDYRQGPEHRFPAASQDVAAVYRKLLDDYAPQNIGVFGSSAGGVLTAMALAWFQQRGLPAPGAACLLSAGATTCAGGDSTFFGPALTSMVPPSVQPNPPIMPIAYLADAEQTDPLVAPVVSLDVLARFPPTLLISGTRSFDLSAAVYTQRRLQQAGATVDLQLWDGMWHCFFYDAELPETAEAFAVMGNFFGRHLGAVRR